MSHRGLRTAPLVLLLALAFALGSVSTAGAAGLTKGVVKKIAAKVVKKQAPSLSVAHADTAGSATTATTAADSLKLGGVTSAQLGVRPIVVTIPVATYPASEFFTLPALPAGSYLLTLSGALSTTASTAECIVSNDTAGGFPLDVFVSEASHLPVLNAVGFAKINAGDTLLFHCGVLDSWAPNPLTLTFTPAASVVTATAATLRGSER